MTYGFGYGRSVRRGAQAAASPSPTYVWLGNTLSAAPALSGVPAQSTYLNPTDTAFVTRLGIKMKSVSGGTTATNSAGFASVPWWQQSSVFHAVEIEGAAGTWQVGIIGSGNLSGNTLLMIDNPAGAATTRQSIALAGQASSLSDTDDTRYTTAGTAIAGVVAGMTLVPVLVTDRGGGVGVFRVYASGSGATIAAIALLAPA